MVSDEKSQRRCFGKHLSTKLFWEATRRQHINIDLQQIAKLMPYRTDVHQRRFWRWVDENVEIATLVVVASEDRAEDAGVTCMVRSDDAFDLLTMKTEGFRGFHFFPTTSVVEPASSNDSSRSTSSIE